MIREWKGLSKGVSKLKGDIVKEEGDMHKHDIDSIKNDMVKIDAQIEECSKKGYKLGYRNLLLFRKSIWLMRIQMNRI